MEWLKGRAEFLTLAGLIVGLAGLIIPFIFFLKGDIQELEVNTQKSIEELKADTQKSIEELKADVREIRTLLISHIGNHNALSAVAQKRATARQQTFLAKKSTRTTK